MFPCPPNNVPQISVDVARSRVYVWVSCRLLSQVWAAQSIGNDSLFIELATGNSFGWKVMCSPSGPSATSCSRQVFDRSTVDFGDGNGRGIGNVYWFRYSATEQFRNRRRREWWWCALWNPQSTNIRITNAIADATTTNPQIHLHHNTKDMCFWFGIRCDFEHICV